MLSAAPKRYWPLSEYGCASSWPIFWPSAVLTRWPILSAPQASMPMWSLTW